MASQRRDATVLLTFGGGDGLQRAGDDIVLQVKLGIGVVISGEAPAVLLPRQRAGQNHGAPGALLVQAAGLGRH
jgi:hypothetical protein